MNKWNEYLDEEELEEDREKLKNHGFNYNQWIEEFLKEYIRKNQGINQDQMDMVYKVMNFVERKLK